MSLSAALSPFRDDLFQGKTILISGATSGIGIDLARAFAALSGRVVATGTSQKKMERETSSSENSGIEFRKLDVRDECAVTSLVAELDRLDVLINCAGISHGNMELDDIGKFIDVIDVNLVAMMRMAGAARKLLAASRGSIINISSMLSYIVGGQSNIVGYTASKTGVLGLTRALAHSYGEEGIRVNAISPGYHKTDMTMSLWSKPASEARVARRTALRRWGTTFDLVGYAVFLASPAAEYITATDLPVDGGFVVGNVVV